MTEPTEPTEQVADRDAEGPSDDDMGTPSRFAPLRWVDQLVDISRRWLAVLIVIGVAPALGLVPILHSRVHFRYTYENTLETSYRYHIVLWMFLSVLAMGGVYAGVWLWRRRREPGLTVDAAFRRLNSQLLPILIFPMIIGIWPHRMQVKEPLLTLSVIGVITAIVFIYSYRALGAAPDWCRRALAWIERWRLHWVLLVLFMVQYSAETMRLVLIEHYNLDTHVYDLGIYTNIFWHNMHGNWLGCTFCKLDVHYSGHYDPILIAFTPLFAISPRAETLLYIQTFWLALGAVPTYLIGRHHLKDTWSALMLAGLYLLNPGLSSANMFEFHSLTLSIPIVLWTVHFLDTDNHLAYWPTLAILLLTREDMAIMSCCVGAYAILSRRSATGLATIGIAVAWFVFIKTQVMTSSEVVAVKSTREADSHMYYFAEAVQNTDEGIKGLVLTLVTNPIFALKLLFKTDKLYFLAYQFLPLLCLPLLSGRRLVLFGYGALFIGLVSRHEVFSMGFHYTSLIVPALILATPAGLKRVTSGRLARERGYERQRLKHALLLTAVAASLLTSWKFGPLFGNRFYKAGWNVMKVDQPRDRIRAYQNLQKVIAEIPQEAAVSAASHIGAHVATRDRVVRWGAYRGVDYILLDMRRLKKKERDRMKRLVARKQFLPVIEYDGLTLYKRNPDYKQPGRTTRTRTTASTPRTRPVRLPPRRGAGKDEQDEDAPVGPEGENVEELEDDTLEDTADDTADDADELDPDAAQSPEERDAALREAADEDDERRADDDETKRTPVRPSTTRPPAARGG